MRHKTRTKTDNKENSQKVPYVDHDAAMLQLKRKCYHEINDDLKYRVRPILLKTELRLHAKRLLAQMMVQNAAEKR